MSKEKIPSNSVPEDYSDRKSPDVNSSVEKASYFEELKDVYLPASKANYSPSEESIERSNDLTSSNLNLVTEAIVTKNNASLSDNKAHENK